MEEKLRAFLELLALAVLVKTFLFYIYNSTRNIESSNNATNDSNYSKRHVHTYMYVYMLTNVDRYIYIYT